MPAQKRHKTKYPGVYYIIGHAISSGKPEKIYYITYRKNQRQIHEKAGRQFQDDMTPARASKIRVNRISGVQPTNKEKREAAEALKNAESSRWTIGRLASEYFNNRPDNKTRLIDENRYGKHLKDVFSEKEPVEIAPLDVDRLRLRLSKTLAPQTVKHVLNLLTWIINFGVKENLCEGLSFHIKKPKVNNVVTEDLTPAQLKSLFVAIEQDSNIQIKNLMKLALFTGMRRGELFKLQWQHIDFEKNFIYIKEPKGGEDQVIPLNNAAKEVLQNHPRVGGSPYVFPGNNGSQRVSAQAGVNKIKKRANLPDKFRPLHGLRHVFASMMASSGQVDMYTLQKLLTHKDPRMTQRYAHLRDETLKQASNLAGELISNAMNADAIVNTAKSEDEQ